MEFAHPALPHTQLPPAQPCCEALLGEAGSLPGTMRGGPPLPPGPTPTGPLPLRPRRQSQDLRPRSGLQTSPLLRSLLRGCLLENLSCFVWF